MTEATELCPSLEGVVILSKVKVKVPQSCLTLCDPMDNSPGQNTGVGSFSLLQGIFPTQGLNPGIPHCKGILYQLSHKGSPRILEWVSFPFSSRSSLPRNRTGVFCVGGRFFTNWAIWEVPLKTYWERQKSYQGSPVLSKAGLCSWGQKPERDGRWRHLEAHSYRLWNRHSVLIWAAHHMPPWLLTLNLLCFLFLSVRWRWWRPFSNSKKGPKINNRYKTALKD